jgi:succinate dehydrogenase / fumarate reductase flavoprotein subunit
VELGLIIIYKLQSQVVSLLESNFSDPGANRLGASALMQVWQTVILFFLILGDYLSPDIHGPISTDSQSLRRQKKELRAD